MVLFFLLSPHQLTPPSPLRISWRWWRGWRIAGRTWVINYLCETLRTRKSTTSTRVTIRRWKPSSSTMWNTIPFVLGNELPMHWRRWSYPSWRRWSPPNMSEVCDRDGHWQVMGIFWCVSSWGGWTWFMCMCTMSWVCIWLRSYLTAPYIWSYSGKPFFLDDKDFKC